MPKYAVVDSDNKWLTFGEFSSADEAIQDAMQSTEFDDPDIMYAFKIGKEIRFKKVERKGHPTYARVK